MERNAGIVALAYLKHWLLKEDHYSQQSPFIYSIYQGALHLLKITKPPTKKEKLALLFAYFCQLTPAKQVLELGIGNELESKFLNPVILGKLTRILDPKSFPQEWNANSAQILELHYFDFALIHLANPEGHLHEALSQCLNLMHAEGIVLLEGIYQNTELNASWQMVKADPRIQLTLDFFDFGIAFFSYSGMKTNLLLSY